MKKSENSISIISGADGPTAVFGVNSKVKKSLKTILHNYIYKLKLKKAKKKLVSDVHTIKELVVYAMKKYGAKEVSVTDRKYEEQRKYHKENLVLMHKLELLGKMKDIQNCDFSNDNAIREFLEKSEIRSQMISKIPDNEINIDFHMYEIKIGNSHIEIKVDNFWNVFSISCSGNKKDIKHLNKILQDLYIYYGVSEEDIREKSDRYLSLLNVLTL